MKSRFRRSGPRATPGAVGVVFAQKPWSYADHVGEDPASAEESREGLAELLPAAASYGDFVERARDNRLTPNEKIDFPDSYRVGRGKDILSAIRTHLPALGEVGSRVLDIGPGCGELPDLIVDLCASGGTNLTLIDNQDMLDLIEVPASATKIPGRFPSDLAGFLSANRERFDAVLVYSVLQYVQSDGSLFGFVDSALSLLAPRGRLLIGDVPNLSKRRRFFASEAGREFHRDFMRTEEEPTVEFNELVPGRIDDSVVFGLLLRARLAGFDSYVLPQGEGLPMANRREDLLFIRP